MARVLLAVPLLAAVLVASRGDGFPVSGLSLSGGGAWLASSEVGQMSLIDGASAELAAKVKVADPPTRLEAVQAGAGAYAIDRSRGTLVRVDGRTYETSPAVSVIPGASTGLQAFAGRQTLFVLDRTRGLLVAADPVSLRIRQQLPVVASVAEGAGVVDGADRLWLLDQATGDLVWLDGGDRRSLPRVADPARARLVRVGERVALVDPASRTVQVLDPRSGRPSARGCVDVDADDTSVQVNGSTTAPNVYLVSGRRGLLLVSDVERGQCATAVLVSDPGADLGVPQEAAGRVFVPNYSTGTVVVVDLTTRRVVADPKVLDPGRFELLSKDGVVFYNDPDSQRAGVIRLDGTRRPVRKYNPENPGQGLVQPGEGARPPQGGGPTSSLTQQPPAGSTPRPRQPVSAAVQIQASATRARVADPITFRIVATSGGGIAAARWSFGDHATAEGVEVSHAWQRPGTFTVLVQATLPNGRQEAVSASVVIDTTTPLDPGPRPGPGPGPGPVTSSSSSSTTTLSSTTTSSSSTTTSSSSTTTTSTTGRCDPPDASNISVTGIRPHGVDDQGHPAYLAQAGDTATFRALDTDACQDVRWDSALGSRSGAVATYSFTSYREDVFSYTFSVTITSTRFPTDRYFFVVVFWPPPSIASLTVDDATPAINQTVTFTSTPVYGGEFARRSIQWRWTLINQDTGSRSVLDSGVGDWPTQFSFTPRVAGRFSMELFTYNSTDQSDTRMVSFQVS
jgi:hypothetical protein